MKTYFIFLILSLGITASCYGQPIKVNLLDTNKLKQGLWIEISDSNKQIGSYINNKKNGQWIYYDNEKLKRICGYSNDTLNGFVIIFNPNGTMKRKIIFQNGRINGQVEFYSSTGKLLAKYSYVYDKISSIDYYVLDKESPPRRHTYLPNLE